MKTIYWNVDTQFDFMRDDESFKGDLAIAGARDIEGNLEKLTKHAEREGLQVVNTADWHDENTEEISESPDFATTFPSHCLAGTKGAEYIPATAPKNAYVIDWQDEGFDVKALQKSREIVLYKDKFDIFSGNRYAEAIVEAIAPERAVVYGVATNVCVDFAVKGLLEKGVEVFVPTDAIKELPGLPLEEVFDSWKEAGAVLTTTDEVIKYRG